MALLGACASNSPPPLPPLSKQTKKVLSVQLVLVPPPKGDWQFAARHESGTVVEKTGNGDTIEVELPPGPCSLRLTADGMVYERPLVLGNVGINEIWQLVGGHRL
jgi:hypothetical protein